MRNRVAFRNVDRSDLSGRLRRDIIFHFHRFENEKNVALLNRLTFLDVDFLNYAGNRGDNVGAARRSDSGGSGFSRTVRGNGKRSPVDADDELTPVLAAGEPCSHCTFNLAFAPEADISFPFK